MKARISLFFILFIATFPHLMAQTAGDFKTVASGDWTSLANWQIYNGSSWEAPTHFPEAADGYIIIGANHQISIPAASTISADQLLVQENGKVLIHSDGTLEILNGPGTDLDIARAENTANPGMLIVNGILKAHNDALITSTAASLVIENGGTYQHHYTMSSGSIPLATWNEGATLLISGYSSNEVAPENLGQTFHHVIWNTPDLNTSQGFINLGGALTTINGNFTVSQTGTSKLSIAAESSTDILNIGNNFIIENGSQVQLSSPVQVANMLAVSNSQLENLSGLSFGNNSTFLLEGTAVFTGQAAIAQGLYSVHYKDRGNITLGMEFPNPETGLANLTLENSSLNLSTPVTVHGDLSLEALGNLILSNTNIFLKGHFINNGLFQGSTNKIVFNGEATQKIEGNTTTSFYDLEILNTASPGLIANAHVNIENSINLGENVTFDPDGGDLATDGGINVTLVSTALDQAAYLAPLPATAEVKGNLVLQYFIPPGKMYRYITTATKGMTLAQWTDDFTVYGSYQGSPGGNASLYIYDEPQGKFIAYPGASGSLESPIVIGKGYIAYMYNGTTPTIIDTRGPVQSGNFSYALTYTESSAVPGQSFLGNPYPSAIEWSSPHWQREGVSPSIVIYKKVNGKDVYSNLNAYTGIGLNADNTKIASGQSFFAQTFGSNPQLSVSENVKIATSNKPIIKDVILLTLSNSTFKDQTTLAFREGTTANFEVEYDSPKAMNTSINLYSTTPDGKQIGQNLQNWFDCNLTFPLVIGQAPADVYQLSFSHLESLSKDVNIILEDSYENKSIAVTPETVYSFGITTDAGTYGANRFKLILSYTVPEITAASYETSCTEEIPVTVNGTVAGKNYFLTLGSVVISDTIAGTFDEVSFMVKKADLTEGNNTISIKGFHPGCDPVTMATNLELDYSGSYTISRTEEATSCTTGAVTLTATASNERASFKWFESLEATTAVHEGTTGSFTTPALEQNTTYYVAAVNTYGCESERVAVEAIIQATPEISAITYEDSCNGEIPVTVNGTVIGKNYLLLSGTTAVSATIAATSEVTSFMVPAASLTEGINTISIQGFHTGCDPVTMATTLELDYSGSYTISTTEGATSCTTGAVTLTATASNERASFKWFESLEATTAVHEGTTGSFTTPALEQNTTYYVAAVNTYGCESERVAVEAIILAIPEISAVTYENSCNGEIPVTVNGTMEGKNYLLLSGTTPITDTLTATSDVMSFMISATSLTEGNNTISIKGFHPGCDPVTMATTLELDFSGSYTISSTEGATSCTTGAVTLTATASNERASFKWFESLEATTAVHEGTTGSFTTPALEQNTTYYVAAVNTYRCESERVAVEAIIQELEKPVIQLKDGVLMSNYATGNQWVFNGSPIANATENSFTPTESGAYGLEVINNDCNLLAEAVEFAITGIDFAKSESAITIYPNPTSNKFQVIGSLFEKGSKINYFIFQHNGTIVLQGSLTYAENEISVVNLKPGFYLVKILKGENIHYEKLIKE